MEKDKEYTENEPNPVSIVDEPAFQSSFKSWIRVVAFIVASVFLPEQVAQAAQFDWRVLWQNQASASLAPSALTEGRNLGTALTVTGILNQIADKPIHELKLSPTLSLTLDKPLNISRQRVEEISNWLMDKPAPCGAKAL